MIRRRFLAGLSAALCAPAIIRTPGLLMPVRAPRSDWPLVSYGILYETIPHNVVFVYEQTTPRPIFTWKEFGAERRHIATSELAWMAPDA